MAELQLTDELQMSDAMTEPESCLVTVSLD